MALPLFRNRAAAQYILEQASHFASLMSSAVPEKGGLVPSFTRATTETGQKWDDNGYLDFTALAGEMIFKGARRERNLVATTSEDFSNAAWTKSVCSVTSTTESGPLGSTNATLITLGGGTTNKAIVYSATAAAPAIPSFYFKAGTHKYVQLMNASDGEAFANFDLDLGVVGTKGTKTTSAIEDVGDGWYRVSALYNSTAILGTSWRVYFVSIASAVYAAATASTGTVYIWGAQLNDITGETDQTTIRPYVSVGVPTDWAGPEYVSNGTFGTDTTGWTAVNSATISVVSGRLKLLNTAAAYGGAYQALTGLAIGAKYVASFSFDRDGSATTVYLSVSDSTACLAERGQANSTAATGILTLPFTATATTHYVSAQIILTSGAYSYFDNISVKPAAYHGSMVDGVKCYDTDRLGNLIATTGSYPIVGYVPWEAQTSIALQSNAFTTTWAAIGTPAATQNVVGPDGATSAWTLTDNDAGATEAVQQNIVGLAASTYSFSVLVKKTTGAQSNYPVVGAYSTTLGNKGALATVDTTNGVATIWTAWTSFAIVTSSASCVSYNSNFWRVTVTFAATATDWYMYLAPAAVGATPTYAGPDLLITATGSAVFYGAMVNLGAFAGPYVPTTTVAVARNADLLTYTGADVANLRTIHCTYAFPAIINAPTNYAIFEVFKTDITTDSIVGRIEGSTIKQRFFTYSGGAAQMLTDHSTALSSATHKVSVSIAVNNQISDVDGIDPKSDLSGIMPVGMNTIRIGISAAASQALNGPVNHIYGWTRNLSQSELGAIDRA